MPIFQGSAFKLSTRPQSQDGDQALHRVQVHRAKEHNRGVRQAAALHLQQDHGAPAVHRAQQNSWSFKVYMNQIDK